LEPRGILSQEGVRICDIDSSDNVDRQLRLRVKALDGDPTDADANDERQSYCHMRIHGGLLWLGKETE
jgi:hypothetical protein